MEPGGSMPYSQGSPVIPILSRINPIPRIDTYFFKIHNYFHSERNNKENKAIFIFSGH